MFPVREDGPERNVAYSRQTVVSMAPPGQTLDSVVIPNFSRNLDKTTPLISPYLLANIGGS